MLSGFNTNYRYRGVLFHLQTEDSGRSNPHIITHLFHGGNILASEKMDYSDRLGASDLDAEVRALMESQHKAMLGRLRAGEHDALIAQRLGSAVLEDLGDTSATLPPEREPEPESAPQRVASAEVGSPQRRVDQVFGERVISQKPLDEVVLDFLVENARKRKRSAK